MSRVLTPEEVDEIEKLRLCNLPVDVLEDLIATVRELREELGVKAEIAAMCDEDQVQQIKEIMTLRATLDRVRAIPCRCSKMYQDRSVSDPLCRCDEIREALGEALP